MKTEELFDKFKHNAEFNGATEVRKHQAAIRRMASGLRTVTIDAPHAGGFGAWLTEKQIEAIQTAAKALEVLGRELEKAGDQAKRIKAARDARQAEATKAVAAAFPGKTITDQVVTIAANGSNWRLNSITEAIHLDKYALDELADAFRDAHLTMIHRVTFDKERVDRAVAEVVKEMFEIVESARAGLTEKNQKLIDELTAKAVAARLAR